MKTITHPAGNVLLTGFSGGIGRATAVELARRGYRLLLVGRDGEKSRRALARIEAAGGAPHRFLPCDLAHLGAVDRLAREVERTEERLDVLINNAGIFVPRRRITGDGYELTFAVNHLAPFLLTNRLLDLLRSTARTTGDARIVNVGSAAYKNAPLDFDDLQHERAYRAFFRVYSRSKLCNLYFTHELARRLADLAVTANCVHPGIVRTEIGRGYGLLSDLVFGWFGRPPEEGARTTLLAATSPDLAGVTGRYFAREREEEPVGPGRNREAAERLWQVSEELVRAAVGDPADNQS